jgi:hypothetical protein
MLPWFNAAEFERFGEQLAAQVISKFPLDPVAAPKPQGSEKRKNKHRSSTPQDVLRGLMAEAQTFSSRNKSNFYKKARFGNAFKWRLREAGYDPGFVDELTMELMLHFR